MLHHAAISARGTSGTHANVMFPDKMQRELARRLRLLAVSLPVPPFCIESPHPDRTDQT